MIERLEAEEALQHVAEIALGFGSVDKHISKRIMAGWQRSVNRKTQRETVNDKKIDAAQMAAIGLGVQKVRKNA